MYDITDIDMLMYVKSKGQTLPKYLTSFVIKIVVDLIKVSTVSHVLDPRINFYLYS